jgi:multidrug resistance efflux pump
LIRWPLRVDGHDPVLRPLTRADARSLISGVIDSVFVREGMTIARGAPIGHLRDGQLRDAVVRSPVAGVVLTPRIEERIGTAIGAGDLLAVIGRTDSLEVEFGVDQEDVTHVHVGDEIRLRATASPRRTFAGRVTSIAPAASGDSRSVRFPVRAALANDASLLKPGMAPYARVLTEPASVLGRLLRGPTRAARLLWWRMWS